MKILFQLIASIQDIFSLFHEEKWYKLLNYTLPSIKKTSSQSQAKANTDTLSNM